MTALALTHPQRIQVNRTDLRDQQSKYLREATGYRIIEVVGRADGEDRCVVDKLYFEEVLSKLKSAIETINVMKDQRLFNQILNASRTIEEDTRLGKLHSLEEAFGED
jgi:flagellar hook-associated protein FlgK